MKERSVSGGMDHIFDWRDIWCLHGGVSHLHEEEFRIRRREKEYLQQQHNITSFKGVLWRAREFGFQFSLTIFFGWSFGGFFLLMDGSNKSMEIPFFSY